MMSTSGYAPTGWYQQQLAHPVPYHPYQQSLIQPQSALMSHQMQSQQQSMMPLQRHPLPSHVMPVDHATYAYPYPTMGYSAGVPSAHHAFAQVSRHSTYPLGAPMAPGAMSTYMYRRKEACVCCRTSHRRCDGGQPCMRCLKLGFKCEYAVKSSSTTSSSGQPRASKSSSSSTHKEVSSHECSPRSHSDAHSDDGHETSHMSAGVESSVEGPRQGFVAASRKRTNSDGSMNSDSHTALSADDAAEAPSSKRMRATEEPRNQPGLIGFCLNTRSLPRPEPLRAARASPDRLQVLETAVSSSNSSPASVALPSFSDVTRSLGLQ